MIFSSISFLILFLPLTVFFYYLLPGIKCRNAVLLIASVVFYALGEPVYIFLLIGSSLVNYALARIMCRCRHPEKILTAAVVLDIGMLCFFKYPTGLPLPIGISFYTFQILSYVIDVYRDRTNLQKNFFSLFLYISFFPQLAAGPIIKYNDIRDQIDRRSFSAEKAAEGLRRFIYGLGKKVLLSNTIAVIVDGIYGWEYCDYNAAAAWTAAVLYCLQLYYDFSGYSDMAIGLGRIFGFDIKENFRYPYESSSIREFWRRWHISLSSWFKEYLYIPLGGNRKGKARTYINKLIVFFCTGFWHGADITFIIWGLIHGIFSVLEEKVSQPGKRKNTFIGWLYTAFVVCIAFVFFRSDTIVQAGHFLAAMFTGFDLSGPSFVRLVSYFDKFTITVIVLAFAGMFDWKDRMETILPRKLVLAAEYAGSVVCLLLCLMSLAVNGYHPFIYFRF